MNRAEGERDAKRCVINDVSWWYRAYIWLYLWALYSVHTVLRPSKDVEAYQQRYLQRNPKPTPDSLDYVQRFLRWLHKYVMVKQAYLRSHQRWDLWDEGVNQSRLARLKAILEAEVGGLLRDLDAQQARVRQLLQAELTSERVDGPEMGEMLSQAAQQFKRAVTAKLAGFTAAQSTLWQRYEDGLKKISQAKALIPSQSSLARDNMLPAEVITFRRELETYLLSLHHDPLPDITYETISDIRYELYCKISDYEKQIKKMRVQYHPDKQIFREEPLSTAQANATFNQLTTLLHMTYGSESKFVRRMDEVIDAKQIFKDPKELAFWREAGSTYELKRRADEAHRRADEAERQFKETKKKTFEAIAGGLRETSRYPHLSSEKFFWPYGKPVLVSLIV